MFKFKNKNSYMQFYFEQKHKHLFNMQLRQITAHVKYYGKLFFNNSSYPADMHSLYWYNYVF